MSERHFSDVFGKVENVVQNVRDFTFVDGSDITAIGDGRQLILFFALTPELVFVILFCSFLDHQVDFVV